MSHNDEILIIKHVFIVAWNISSLGQFCWWVLSDWTITWVPRGMTSIRQANMRNDMKTIFFTFDFHILPGEHFRRIGGRIFFLSLLVLPEIIDIVI